MCIRAVDAAGDSSAGLRRLDAAAQSKPQHCHEYNAPAQHLPKTHVTRDHASRQFFAIRVPQPWQSDRFLLGDKKRI
jgi:hypothetical protein